MTLGPNTRGKLSLSLFKTDKAKATALERVSNQIQQISESADITILNRLLNALKMVQIHLKHWERMHGNSSIDELKTTDGSKLTLDVIVSDKSWSPKAMIISETVQDVQTMALVERSQLVQTQENRKRQDVKISNNFVRQIFWLKDGIGPHSLPDIGTSSGEYKKQLTEKGLYFAKMVFLSLIGRANRLTTPTIEATTQSNRFTFTSLLCGFRVDYSNSPTTSSAQNNPFKILQCHIRPPNTCDFSEAYNFMTHYIPHKTLLCQELDDEKQRKLREHHEKVERLSAQKREKKKLQNERLAKDQLNDYESDLKNPTLTQQRQDVDQPRTQGLWLKKLVCMCGSEEPTLFSGVSISNVGDGVANCTFNPSPCLCRTCLVLKAFFDLLGQYSASYRVCTSPASQKAHFSTRNRKRHCHILSTFGV
ncbi:hypothetical protein CLF_105443 [Clonorchis sinensis]|uniref:Uncharacterized protein n=1 Tax=Clonorchis sinensis TaxID=79923 RepID=G7YPB3_CLOSI|nr:hypothetical protein CLF_105443 [Clonorchis sinensis]